MPTSVKENYLKALYFLDQEDHRINITDLSKKLGVSKPTASNMVKSLEEQGWVIYEKYKPVKLTEKGRKAAALVIRKHRLTEMFLAEVMGFGWEEVHEIAEQMEHIDSDPLFARMDEMLNHPTVDPHGSPIPDKDGVVVEQNLKLLSSFLPKQRGQLAALANSSKELLYHLNQCNIKLGSVIQLIQVEAFDESRLIQCDQQSPILISQKVAESLLLTPLD
ncbi:MAG: metal-dependent transcriptional regulator [Bacteroidota bacterium]